MHRRVRLLYLEFLHLAPQLCSFYTPRSASTATNATAEAPSSSPRPLFLRVPQNHPICVPLRSFSAVEFLTSPHGQSETADTVVVFKLQRIQEMELLDSYMPRNWRNDGRARINNECSSSRTTASQLSPEAEFRAHVQRLFYANALVPIESAEWKRCLARGRYELHGIQNVLHVRKYRALHKRYGWASQLSRVELEAVWDGDVGQVEQALLGLSNKDVYGYAAAEDEEEVKAQIDR